MNSVIRVPDDEFARDQRFTLSHFFGVLKRFWLQIALGIAVPMFLYAIVAGLLVVMGPGQRVVSQPFRLEFPGAAQGMYPNGLRFSTSDVVAAPIIAEAYRRNDLGRFLSFRAFADSLVVLDSNEAYLSLVREYQAKLSDRGFTAPERDQLQLEFERKKASLNKNEYALVFTSSEDLKRIPVTVARKVLADVLQLWAANAAVAKGALHYRVPRLTEQFIQRDAIDSDEVLIALTTLRLRITQIANNLQVLKDLPGTELARTGKGASLAEIELELADLQRRHVEPLISRAFRSGLVRDRARVLAVLKAQLAFDQRTLNGLDEQIEVSRRALQDYEREQNASRPPSGTDPRGPERVDGVVPQLGESFIDRLMSLAQGDADREYRQRLVEQIKGAGLAAIPARRAIEFDLELLEQIENATRTDTLTEAATRAEFNKHYEHLLRLVNGISEIYSLASRNLLSSAQLYTTTAPASMRTERAVSVARLILGGIVVMLLSLGGSIVFAVLRDRMQHEASADSSSAEVGAPASP